MSEKEKIPVAIYQLDCTLYEGSPFADIVAEVVRKINANQPERIWEPQPVDTEYQGRVMIYSSRNRFPPGWRRFLRPALGQDASLRTSINVTHEYLCFISNDPQVFVVTGGMGAFHAIDPHVHQQFGLDILVRVIQKNHPVIKAIGDRGVTGILLGQSRNFREDQRLSNEDAFGRIYKEVKADLKESILVRDFGFPRGSLSRAKSGCLAKTSFKISKSITFPQLLSLTQSIRGILSRDANFALNKVQLIDKRRKQNYALLDALRDHFVDTLFNQYQNGQPFDIDLLNRDYESYLDATTYVLQLNATEEVEFEYPPGLYDVIRELETAGSLMIRDATEFKHSVLLKNLRAMDEDEQTLTSETVLKQLHGELAYNGKHYFYVDEEWYEVHSSFIQDLNRECSSIIAECWDDRLMTEVFDGDDEGEYNLKYLNQPGWVVLDTITPENIELCDLLHYATDRICLVAVKQGFDNSLRDLTAQINIAANRLQEDSRDNFRFVQNVEDTARRGSTSGSATSRILATQTFPAGGLVGAFRRVNVRNICFCLAVVDTAAGARSLNGDLSTFRSNIAKYFLIQLYRAVNGLRFDFKIIQLPKV